MNSVKAIRCAKVYEKFVGAPMVAPTTPYTPVWGVVEMETWLSGCQSVGEIYLIFDQGTFMSLLLHY